MTSNTGFFVGFLFFDVVALLWAARELWTLRRGKDQKATPGEAPPSPEGSGHPER
jgi:hypothetical protein